MDIAYEGKSAEIFGNYVEHPEDRVAGRKFDKTFNRELRGPANKLHARLKSAQSAMSYNALYSTNQNGIEKIAGCKKKERLKLKVRINQAWRKEFYGYSQHSDKLYTVEEWEAKGNLAIVTSVLVFNVHKHHYQ